MDKSEQNSSSATAASKAKRKYNKSNYTDKLINFPSGLPEKVTEALEKHGYGSFRAYVIDALIEKYERHEAELHQQERSQQ